MNTPVEERLRSLPELTPPADAWQRVLRRHRRNRRRVWQRLGLGLATAACAAAVAVLVVGPAFYNGEPLGPADIVATTVPPVPSEIEVQRLRARSQALERALRGLPRGPRVVRADTAMAIAELEERLAVVDYQLNEAADRPDDDPRRLWRQRVELMDRLLQVRYTEAGMNSF